VWVGLLTDTVFLLVAAMLIAPFAGPAVNAAIATARGDAGLLGRALARYLAAVATATVSGVAVLLPLAAGAAGALQLVQSERSSLVSGAAVGLLVAAALAPPAGVVGMAATLGAWEMVGNAAFLLALQLAGINLAGALVFRLSGVTSRGSRYPRGRPWVVSVALAGPRAHALQRREDHLDGAARTDVHDLPRRLVRRRPQREDALGGHGDPQALDRLQRVQEVADGGVGHVRDDAVTRAVDPLGPEQDEVGSVARPRLLGHARALAPGDLEEHLAHGARPTRREVTGTPEPARLGDEGTTSVTLQWYRCWCSPLRIPAGARDTEGQHTWLQVP
jgi:hypothetical protein